ncbi:MAG: alpha/beta hydrolase [Pyrinomonadaceae bacterium]
MPLFIAFICAIAVTGQTRESRVEIESDGWKLIADITIPNNDRLPVVLMLNKANGNREAYRGLAKRLADLGIASLRVDMRAHGESINKGRFGSPFDAKMQSLLVGSDRDVTAAIGFLKSLKNIDANRIGIIGASYSGEEMVAAARRAGYVKAYAALSPGSFSDESINAIDNSRAAWIFFRSADEPNLKGFFEDLRKSSTTARTVEISGSKHATDIFETLPEVQDLIAAWFKERL